MSLQIFLRGRLLGIEDFLVTPASGDDEFTGRAHWVTLLTEILPRALLAEFGLARVLLGTSGGDQFLVVLPSEIREAAEAFLSAAATAIQSMSGGGLRLIWGITENLGDWSDIRRRLNDELSWKQGTPAAGLDLFTSPASVGPPPSHADLAAKLRAASTVGWSPELPAQVLVDEGKHTWQLDGVEGVLFTRHNAPGHVRPSGVLRGDVDNFGIRLRRLQTIEEHLQLSLTYKQFFAGELKLLCSMPEFWQKVNILYTGGDDFAVYGEWDALLPLAREIERVFHKFAEHNLKELPGPEGKTITMAVAVDRSADLRTLFEQAGQNLELAKSESKDCIFALGRILEWKQLANAAELKADLTRLIAKFGASREYLDELCGLYRETAGTRTSRRARSAERPWRYHRRLNRILPAQRSREGQKVRQDLIAGFVGRNPANVKLRPSGRVALEWARLAAVDEVTEVRES